MGDLIVVSEKDRRKLWKEHMEKIMNVENESDQMVEDIVEGPVDGVTDEEVMEAINKMQLGKADGPSEVNMDMIIASGKFGVGVMRRLCQRGLDGKGMPEEWKTSVVPIFKGKGVVMDYRQGYHFVLISKICAYFQGQCLRKRECAYF